MSGSAWTRSLAGLFSLRGLFLVLGILAVVLLVWFGGPLLAIAGWAPLASPAARVIFLLLLVVIVLIKSLWQARKQRKDNEQVVNEMMAGTDKDEQLKEEVDTQRDRLRQALALVKKWKPGRFGSVYELPWYMIIGAPGSGKSTALLNSGLEFPLRDEMGIDSVRGVGGTRYCDWWFTNRAVLIDTAGRYTTQESADKRDARGWNSFLGLLKKYRPRQPINGVILSISVADLLEQTPTEQMLHARALKQRVQELKNRLGVVFPVYVVLTKFDLLEGFADTFGMLSEQEREEVFGMTFDLHAVKDAQALPAAFDQEFDALLARLSNFLLHRLQQERTAGTRRRIYQFPKQTALLRAPLWNLIKEVFYPSAYEEVPLLRGIYLVSSAQDGKTLDKVSSMVDRQFQLQVPKAAARAMPENDGFFLKRLFEQIVFSEYGLAGSDGRKEKHLLWARRGAFAAIGAGSVALASAWVMSYQWNASLVATYKDEVIQLQQVLTEQHQDWVRLDSLLNRAASMPGVQGSPLPEGGPRHLGLYQGDRLSQEAEAAYGKLLQHHFANELKLALESGISTNLHNLEYLYETLKTYLMLNQRRHLDVEQVHMWLAFTLSRELPGEINADVRESLLGHLDHYLQLGQTLPLDRELVSRARAELTAMPLAERAYQRIKMDAAASRLPEFRLPMVLGSVAERVFERRSGASLHQGIPGLYTLNGYKGIFEPEKNKIVGRLLEDAWVYGDESKDYRQLDEQQIRAEVEDQYFRDYIHYWETLLADLRLRSFSNQAEGVRVANLLAGPEAPVSRLMAAVKANTTLSAPDERNPSLDAAADAARTRLTQRSRELGSLMAMAPGNAEPEVTLVDRTFAPVHKLDDSVFDALSGDARTVARYFEEQSGGRPAALATVSRAQFDQAVRDFNRTLNEGDTPVLRDMLGGFVNDSRRQVQVTVTRQINDIWRTTVYADYRRAIAGNYPFNPGSGNDVALMDFANFFGYGGTLDTFFDQHLRPHVDTRRSPWRLTSDVGINARSLRLFETAQQIREAFFEPGSRNISVGYTLRPKELDSRITQLLVDVDGRSLIYRHGPPRTMSFVWPEQDGIQQTRISMTPGASGGTPVQATYQGIWSIFRLIQAGGGMNGEGRVQDISLRLDDYTATLEMTTASVKHPFNLTLLENFRLPQAL
ncbi:MAG: type VI secretion system membrane subunit TssM [Marinobacter sp.]|nr:type VI secretion system membrane subunit TssM [Marinobacter sp.]